MDIMVIASLAIKFGVNNIATPKGGGKLIGKLRGDMRKGIPKRLKSNGRSIGKRREPNGYGDIIENMPAGMPKAEAFGRKNGAGKIRKKQNCEAFYIQKGGVRLRGKAK